jgi:hypothetical protein
VANVKITALVIVGVLIAGAIAWYAAEAHYDSCVDAAIATHPLGGGGYDDEVDRYLGNETDAMRARRAAVNRCSRWPW